MCVCACLCAYVCVCVCVCVCDDCLLSAVVTDTSRLFF